MESNQLAAMLSTSRKALAPLWANHLSRAMAAYGIETPARQAMFLAQVLHESNELTAMEENLNYTRADRILTVFPRYFPGGIEEAKTFVRSPARLASRVYAGRYGNGSEESGDGWLYRGRGLIAITFKDNYRAIGRGLRLDLVTCPDLLVEPCNAAASAAFFWQSHCLNRFADSADLAGCTKVINGGNNGYRERLAFWQKAKAALGVKQ